MGRIPSQKTTRITRIGHIRIGDKTVNAAGKEHPRSLDYFVASGTYSQLFHDEFGEKPNCIEICFMSDDDDVSCDQRYEIRKGGDLYGYSHNNAFHLWDGEKYLEIVPKDAHEFMERAEARLREKDKNAKWETVLYLNFIIIRLRRVFGYWTLTTKGAASSVPNIVSTFDTVKEMTGGRVKGIPFDLRVEKVKSNKPDNKSVFPVVTIIPNMSMQNLDNLKKYIDSGKTISGLLSDDTLKLITEV